MSIVVPFAIRNAIAAARQEVGIPTTDWFQLGMCAKFRSNISMMVSLMSLSRYVLCYIDLGVSQYPRTSSLSS